MPQVTLYRLGESGGEMYGALRIGDRARFVTLEEAWRDNRTKVSCVPVGKYLCMEYESPKFGHTYILNNVIGRSSILFHWGNTSFDTEGCILIGSSFNGLQGGHGITSSKIAFEKFMILMRGISHFDLEIKNCF
jgi:hypothetical protein